MYPREFRSWAPKDRLSHVHARHRDSPRLPRNFPPAPGAGPSPRRTSFGVRSLTAVLSQNRVRRLVNAGSGARLKKSLFPSRLPDRRSSVIWGHKAGGSSFPDSIIAQAWSKSKSAGRPAASRSLFNWACRKMVSNVAGPGVGGLSQSIIFQFTVSTETCIGTDWTFLSPAAAAVTGPAYPSSPAWAEQVPDRAGYTVTAATMRPMPGAEDRHPRTVRRPVLRCRCPAGAGDRPP